MTGRPDIAASATSSSSSSLGDQFSLRQLQDTLSRRSSNSSNSSPTLLSLEVCIIFQGQGSCRLRRWRQTLQDHPLWLLLTVLHPREIPLHNVSYCVPLNISQQITC